MRSFILLSILTSLPFTFGQNLLPGGDLETPGAPGFIAEGDVTYGPLAYVSREHVGRGFRFSGAKAGNAGTLSTTVNSLPAGHRWFRLRINAMAEDHFAVANDGLYLEAAFFKNAGATSLDKVRQRIYGIVANEREDLKDKGTNKSLGHGVWRFYDLEFRTPFAEVDTLVVSAGFAEAVGGTNHTQFLIDEMSLSAIPDPASYRPAKTAGALADPPALASLLPLGGRWYFDPKGGDKTAPAQFDHTNSDQLLYLGGGLEAPFADNMSAIMQPGFYDLSGEMVTERREVTDNLVITLTETHLVMKTRGLPNHPTATFPDRWRSLDGNPNYVQEQDKTYYIPFAQTDNPERKAMQDESNNDYALPGGPIGIAVNGVVFFNPFDHILTADAVFRLDRCCGHPAPNKQYHYHKYPACVKSPWSDDGRGHSPVIGFSFDGYPVYGPYEAKGVLALESDNKLNEFNIHEDEARGLHYHVTPGHFPHIIGGHWGREDPLNRRRGGGGGGPRPGGQRPGGPPGR